MSEYEVVIVGAGAAGLAAGRALAARGRSVMVCEARDRVGGRAWTGATRLGLPVDLGCNWLHSADRSPLVAIARELGFSIDERPPDWSRNPANPRRDAWRIAYAELSERIHAVAAKGPDMPAAALLDAGGKWNAALNAISTYANGTELDRVSVVDNARYADSAVNFRVREGYGAVIVAAARSVPVTLGATVRRIDLAGDRIAVETSRGALRARTVIVALPTDLLARGDLAFAPALPEKVAAAAGLPLGLANKLHLELSGAADDLPSDRHVLGAPDRTETGSYQLRPHGRPIVEGYFGGKFARAIEEAGVDEMTEFARDELAGHFGADIKKRLSPLAASAWARDPFARGSYSCALPGHADDRAILSAPVDGRLFFAGEATHPSDFSTAHGAWLSGLRAADEAEVALAGK